MAQDKSVKSAHLNWADDIISKSAENSFLEKERQEYRAQLNKIKEDSFKSVTMETVKQKLQGEHTGILQW